MLTPEQVYLVCGAVDMRKGMDSLTLIIGDTSPYRWQDEGAFIFCNKARTRIKVLRWDKHGVWLCLRRLHRGRFNWPRQGDEIWSLSQAQFDWLTKGIDWQKVAGDDLSKWHF